MYKHIYALITITITITAPAAPGSRDPFPIGHSMASQGAIVDPFGPTGRQPWLPAALYRDTLRCGAAFSAVSYHGGGSVSQYAVGGFGAFGPIVGKLSIARLDALGVYYEQSAALSLGGFWRLLSYSVDANLYQSGLRAPPRGSRSAASAGATLSLGGRRVNAALSAEGLTLLPSGAIGFDPPMSVTARLCTARNRYGVQGAAVIVAPSGEPPLRIALAQEYRIGKSFAVSASIASNPATIGFGVTADMRPASFAASAVNHPELGWSRGAAADYYK
jgi:hypothetical protein